MHRGKLCGVRRCWRPSPTSGQCYVLCVLNIPGPEDIFVLQTDASAGGVGAVLNVVRDDKILPVAFFSKQLQGAERRYSTAELERLAVYQSVTFLANFRYSREFTVYTDHQALVLMRSGKAMNRRVHGWALKLHDFSFRIVYRYGVANANADGLSRQGTPRTGIRSARGDVGA